MFNNPVIEAAQQTCRDAVNTIQRRFPEAPPEVINSFVKVQFELAAGNSNDVVSVDDMVATFEAMAERRSSGDTKMEQVIEKALYQSLVALEDGRRLRLEDFMAKFQALTGKGLRPYWDVFQDVIVKLENSDYARAVKAPNGAYYLTKGIDFDAWGVSRQAPQVATVTNNHFNVNVSGNNARFNHASTDSSTNVLIENAAALESIQLLREAISALPCSHEEKAEALSTVDEIENEFQTKKRKGVLGALIASLPAAAELATVVEAVKGLL